VLKLGRNRKPQPFPWMIASPFSFMTEATRLQAVSRATIIPNAKGGEQAR